MLNEIKDGWRNLIGGFFHSLFYEYDQGLSEKKNIQMKDQRFQWNILTGTHVIKCGRRTCKSPFSPRLIAVDWSVNVNGDE